MRMSFSGLIVLVKEDVIRWGKWITKELGLAGFRFDAVKRKEIREKATYYRLTIQISPKTFWETSLTLYRKIMAMTHQICSASVNSGRTLSPTWSSTWIEWAANSAYSMHLWCTTFRRCQRRKMLIFELYLMTRKNLVRVKHAVLISKTRKEWASQCGNTCDEVSPSLHVCAHHWSLESRYATRTGTRGSSWRIFQASGVRIDLATSRRVRLNTSTSRAYSWLLTDTHVSSGVNRHGRTDVPITC